MFRADAQRHAQVSGNRRAIRRRVADGTHRRELLRSDCSYAEPIFVNEPLLESNKKNAPGSISLRAAMTYLVLSRSRARKTPSQSPCLGYSSPRRSLE